jgi:hypothetical protein
MRNNALTRAALAAVLGATMVLGPNGRQMRALIPAPFTNTEPPKPKPKSYYVGNGTREMERRKRQIASGFITESNGLVRTSVPAWSRPFQEAANLTDLADQTTERVA